MSINSIKAIIILQNDGRRAIAKYYDDQINQKQFERKLFSKSKSSKGKDEIIVLDGQLVFYKFLTDSHIYVVGCKDENPLILDSVLTCLTDVIKEFPENGIIGNTILDNLSKVILALDEICHCGMILETDPNLVSQRITVKNDDSLESMAQRTARRFLGL